jgi:nitronate monooxygenase
MWAEALADLEPEATCMTRAYTGRLGRSIETDYVRAANSLLTVEGLSNRVSG